MILGFIIASINAILNYDFHITEKTTIMFLLTVSTTITGYVLSLIWLDQKSSNSAFLASMATIVVTNLIYHLLQQTQYLYAVSFVFISMILNLIRKYGTFCIPTSKKEEAPKIHRQGQYVEGEGIELPIVRTDSLKITHDVEQVKINKS
jgi:hypothetical protein